MIGLNKARRVIANNLFVDSIDVYRLAQDIDSFNAVRKTYSFFGGEYGRLIENVRSPYSKEIPDDTTKERNYELHLNFDSAIVSTDKVLIHGNMYYVLDVMRETNRLATVAKLSKLIIDYTNLTDTSNLLDVLLGV